MKSQRDIQTLFVHVFFSCVFCLLAAAQPQTITYSSIWWRRRLYRGRVSAELKVKVCEEMKPGMHWRMVPWFCSSWFHTLQDLTFSLDMKGECAQELDGDQSFTVLRYGGLHLVMTEVVPISGDADKKVEFISIKITSVCIDFDLLRAKYSVGGCHQTPIDLFFFFSRSVPVPDFVILCTKLEFQMALPVSVTGFVCTCCLWASENCLI